MPSARLPAPPPPAPLLTLVAGDLAHPASHVVRTYWEACVGRIGRSTSKGGVPGSASLCPLGVARRRGRDRGRRGHCRQGAHRRHTEVLRRLPERLQLHLAALTEEYEPVMLFLKLNHSCEPNVGFGGNIVLVAMSDIEAGEELSTDYALFDDYEGSMDCNCGRG